MAGVRIDSGPLSATYRFSDIPQNQWKQLVREKRNFLATKIKYDCRCLIEFCEEANEVWETLEYASAADMIRNGYELDPQQIELAVAWLKINGTDAAIGIDEVTKRRIAEAVKTKEPGKRGPKPKEDVIDNNVIKYDRGPTTKNTLRRIARDKPELLDRIESGELSVNAAAIQAGIRKKPTQAEICVKAFRKAENRLESVKLIVNELEPYEAAIVRDWILERLS